MSCSNGLKSAPIPPRTTPFLPGVARLGAVIRAMLTLSVFWGADCHFLGHLPHLLTPVTLLDPSISKLAQLLHNLFALRSQIIRFARTSFIGISTSLCFLSLGACVKFADRLPPNFGGASSVWGASLFLYRRSPPFSPVYFPLPTKYPASQTNDIRSFGGGAGQGAFVNGTALQAAVDDLRARYVPVKKASYLSRPLQPLTLSIARSGWIATTSR